MKDRIKKIRKERDLTQTEFAAKIGSTQNVVANYETGRRSPSASVINNICKTFNVNEEWLRTGKGEMSAPEPTDELDALAAKYDLSDRDFAFIEHLLSNADARRALEDFCISYATTLLKGNTSSSSANNTMETSDQKIEAEVADYRRTLVEQKKAEDAESLSSGEKDA